MHVALKDKVAVHFILQHEVKQGNDAYKKRKQVTTGKSSLGKKRTLDAF